MNDNDYRPVRAVQLVVLAMQLALLQHIREAAEASP